MTGIHQALAGGRILSAPSIVSTTTASSVGADVYSIPVPSGVQAGRRLFGAVTCNAAFTAISGPVTPSGMSSAEFFTGNLNNLRLLLFYKVLDGSETGNITGDLPFSSVRYCAFATVLGDITSDAGNFGSLAEGVSNATSVTPDTITAPWGTANASLFISCLAWLGEPAPALASYPANYNLIQTTVQQTNINFAFAARRAITSSESPGAWGVASTSTNMLTTITRFRGA